MMCFIFYNLKSQIKRSTEFCAMWMHSFRATVHGIRLINYVESNMLN